MALERKLWNFDFILYRIVSNYCRLSVLGNVLSGSKTFPRRSLLPICTFKLLPDPLPEYPRHRRSSAKGLSPQCQLLLAVAFHLAG